MRGRPDTPANRVDLLTRLARDGGTILVHDRDPHPLVEGLLRDGLLTAIAWHRTSTEFAISEAGRACLAAQSAG